MTADHPRDSRVIYVDESTAALPIADRLAWWQERTRNELIRTVITCDDAAHFRAEARAIDLGDVVVSRLRYSPIRYVRSRRLIQQSDPEQIVLAFSLSGQLGMTINRTERVCGTGDVLCYDTSRPFHGFTGGDPDRMATQLLVQVPRKALPLRAGELDRLIGVPLPASDGVGALLGDYLVSLARNADRYAPADAARLATVTLDLVTATLGHHLDTALPPETHHQVLRTRIYRFIERRLADPALSPGVIASAHGISPRHLHKLFADQGRTVAGWIRQRRLERSRRDLADPRLWSQPIHVVARRSGFVNAAHFSRLFTATYGQPPSDYRRAAQRAAAAHELCQDAGRERRPS